MPKEKLSIRLYGAFECSKVGKRKYIISGEKQRAIIAMLATAANGTHTRSWIQDVLWGRSEVKNRRESLRRALADLRKIFGDDFVEYFNVTNIDVRLYQARVIVEGDASDGEFLEGIDILGQGGFEEWLAGKRDRRISNVVQPDHATPVNVFPTVAIIPFLTHSGLAQDAQFSDLLALEVSRTLTRSQYLNVISHLSSRRFSGQLLELRRVKAALQIDYLVNGTLRIEGDEFRLDADLLNASSGHIYWSRTYQGRLSELLSFDDTIARELANHIGYSILKASVETARSRPLPQIESHALFMAAISDVHRHKLVNFSNARKQLEHLIERSPDHSVLHAWLAKWYILSISQGWSENPRHSIAVAHDCVQRGLDIEPGCAMSLTVDGMILGDQKAEVDRASKRFEEALAIDPNHALAWLMYARMHAYAGEGREAVRCASLASFLSPLDPYSYFFDSLAAMCHVVDGNLNRGYDLISRSLSANPHHISTHRAKVITLQMMGHDSQAHSAAKKLMRLEPNLTVENYLNTHPAGATAIGHNWANALKTAGVPLR